MPPLPAEYRRGRGNARSRLPAFPGAAALCRNRADFPAQATLRALRRRGNPAAGADDQPRFHRARLQRKQPHRLWYRRGDSYRRYSRLCGDIAGPARHRLRACTLGTQQLLPMPDRQGKGAGPDGDRRPRLTRNEAAYATFNTLSGAKAS
ncbi:hypothetical protein RHECNPAF_1740064 [Rhizobium etli CNPAF512]|nr:hypothetical protein RHECNPAF_1740064 [Rhizobium etli CNPAF512]